MWNGTAPNLKATPTTMKAMPSSSPMSGALPCATANATPSIRKVPVTPYRIEIPYSSAPEAIAPSTKYFMADSAATPSSRSKATSA